MASDYAPICQDDAGSSQGSMRRQRADYLDAMPGSRQDRSPGEGAAEIRSGGVAIRNMLRHWHTRDEPEWCDLILLHRSTSRSHARWPQSTP